MIIIVILRIIQLQYTILTHQELHPGVLTFRVVQKGITLFLSKVILVSVRSMAARIELRIFQVDEF